MKNLQIYEGIDKLGDKVIIKTITDKKDFIKGLQVFQNPPYNEILTEEDCINEYNEYDSNGIVFGAYVNDKIAGINCILNDVPNDYSIAFKNKDKVSYYAGLAVLEEYRKRGLGKLLVNETQKYLEDDKNKDYTFARILCVGSMSEGIFKLNGFIDAYDNDELIVDEVTYQRNNSSVPTTDERKYMVKTLNNKNNSWYKK